MNTTVAAIATPPGKSGVAVVRISGPEALQALARVCPSPVLLPRVASLKKLFAADGEPIDSALIIHFPAPHSFTGEDVVEIHTHGSRAVISALLAALDLPAAPPGEFTRRAMQSGKLDLLEVEALADLIDAETEAQRLQALRQFSGEVTRTYEELREGIIEVLALMEAYIDFPDEDIPEAVTTQARALTHGLITEIHALLDDNGVAERIRDGFSVVIMGAPNAGKSTLLNALAKRDIAIVSEIAGTTRDAIEVSLDIGGFPVTLVDTAGLRETADVVESIGVARARKRAEHADIILALSAPDAPCPALAEGADSVIYVQNKSDISVSQETHAIAISSKTGAGIDILIGAIREKLDSLTHRRDSAIITRKRHREALESAFSYLNASLSPLPLELACEELRLAAREIGKITGKIDVDSVLDVVFSRFCIGK